MTRGKKLEVTPFKWPVTYRESRDKMLMHRQISQNTRASITHFPLYAIKPLFGGSNLNLRNS